jgi:hypothetical protein
VGEADPTVGRAVAAGEGFAVPTGVVAYGAIRVGLVLLDQQ